MRTNVWLVIAAASFTLVSCQIDDVYIADFLNDMNIDQEDDDDSDSDSDIVIEDICGDGRIGPNESCDDGNTMREDGCNEYCWLEMGWFCPEPGMPCYYDGYPVCGDGVVSGNESCDDGINDGTYGTCAPGCVLAPHCGDGYIQQEFGEECDPGWIISICNWDCTFLEGEDCYYFDMTLHFGETIQNDAGEYCTCIEEGEVTCYVVDPII